MMYEPGCMHCFNRRSYHCEWPYDKARALWDKIMEDSGLGYKRFPLEWINKPLLVQYTNDGVPYIVCGPLDYAFPSLMKVVV
jgi:hypothetical protein